MLLRCYAGHGRHGHAHGYHVPAVQGHGAAWHRHPQPEGRPDHGAQHGGGRPRPLQGHRDDADPGQDRQQPRPRRERGGLHPLQGPRQLRRGLAGLLQGLHGADVGEQKLKTKII